jgi:hypothetical protein
MAMTGDRFDGCEPTLMVVDVVTVLTPDVVVDDDAVATEMIPGNLDMTDGEPEPCCWCWA